MAPIGSAAGGTAIATGVAVKRGVSSQALLGDCSDLPTLLEVSATCGALPVARKSR
ncbi:MAG: hypothetical protein OEZ06_13855 [Myxococcales bacterium]|nr:hypothetical protein [Myxococcales bacterium]